MGKNGTVIHCNRSLRHQVELAECLQEGTDAEISYSVETPATTHIVLGPWYALKRWRFDNTLYIDRAHWGDPDSISVHWLAGGEKVRTQGNPFREHPEVKPWKTGSNALILCDFGMDGIALGQQYNATIRKHPAEGENTPLAEILDGYDIAIGKRTTALVDAAIAGLKVITTDPHSPVWPISGQRGDREQWLNDLAWHNWSKDEIRRGAMWEAIHYRR